MKELVRLFVQIALMRKGPQDLPNSAVLLALTVAANFIVNFLVSAALPPIALDPGLCSRSSLWRSRSPGTRSS
jgi:hypothetical protein